MCAPKYGPARKLSPFFFFFFEEGKEDPRSMFQVFWAPTVVWPFLKDTQNIVMTL